HAYHQCFFPVPVQIKSFSQGGYPLGPYHAQLCLFLGLLIKPVILLGTVFFGLFNRRAMLEVDGYGSGLYTFNFGHREREVWIERCPQTRLVWKGGPSGSLIHLVPSTFFPVFLRSVSSMWA